MNSKATLITGATSGIGQALSQLLAKDSQRLYTVGRSPLEPINDFHVHFQADLGDMDSIDRMFTKIKGPLGCFIACAGHNQNGTGAFHEHNFEDWTSVIDVNLKGLMCLSQKVIRNMLPQKSGDLVFVSSSVTQTTFPNMTAYTASKYGVNGFANGLRADYNQHGLRVMTIQPGLTKTSFGQRRHGTTPGQSIYEEHDNVLNPQQVAEAISFMTSQAGNAWIPDLVLSPKGHKVC